MVKSGCEECNFRFPIVMMKLSCANSLLWPSSMLWNTLTQNVDMKFSSVMKFQDRCVLRFKAEIYQQNSTDVSSILAMEWWMGCSANWKLAPELLGCAEKLKIKSVIWYLSFGRKTVPSSLLVYENLKFIEIQIKPLPTTHLTVDVCLLFKIRVLKYWKEVILLIICMVKSLLYQE